MRKNTTKRALLMSVLSLMLCIAMLIGTTYAWFTDSVTTGVNSITSGTLAVDIVDENGASLENGTLYFRDANGDTDVLWEPGATFELDSFRIVNTGNLHLKYKLEITAFSGDEELLDVITFTVGGETMADYFAAQLDKPLAPAGEDGDESELITIKGTMDTAAGNAYMGKTLSAVEIKVYATQMTAEYDSFNNTYDKDAVFTNTVGKDLQQDLEGNYVATSLDGLATAAATVGIGVDSVTLMDNGEEIEVPVVSTANTDLTAASLASDSGIIVATAGTYKLASNGTSEEITIVGTEDTVLDMSAGTYLENADVTIKGATIKLGLHKIGSDYCGLYTENPTFEDCTFDGGLRVGRDGAKFINCTFNFKAGVNDYVYHYGNDTIFENCVFNTGGKAICLYSDGNGVVPKVSVINCEFNATQSDTAWAILEQPCAAIEIDNFGCGVDLTISGNTYSDYFSGEWRIKSYKEKDDEVGQNRIYINGVEYTQTALDGKLMTVTDRVVTFD